MIYVNDLLLAAPKLNTKRFADDTVLTLTQEFVTDLNNPMNAELRKLDNWLKLNKLSLNYNKTKFMIIGTKTPTPINISIGGHAIEQVSHIKYLGGIFDDNLNWKPHIQHVCSCIIGNGHY